MLTNYNTTIQFNTVTLQPLNSTRLNITSTILYSTIPQLHHSTHNKTTQSRTSPDSSNTSSYSTTLPCYTLQHQSLPQLHRTTLVITSTTPHHSCHYITLTIPIHTIPSHYNNNITELDRSMLYPYYYHTKRNRT